MNIYSFNTTTVNVKLLNIISVYFSLPNTTILGIKITGKYHCWIFSYTNFLSYLSFYLIEKRL